LSKTLEPPGALLASASTLIYLGVVRRGALLQDQALAIVRANVTDIVSGTVFVFLGLTACGIAGMRRRSGVRVLIWWGIWSAIYAVHPLLDALDALALLPHWLH